MFRRTHGILRWTSLLGGLAFALGALGTDAQATNVTYSTMGQFAQSNPNGSAIISSAGGGTNNVLTLTDGTNMTTLRFNGQNTLTVDATPFTFSDLGTFTFTQVGGTRLDAPAAPNDVTFTLTVNQTMPTPAGSEVFQGVLTGFVSMRQSTLEINFSNTTGAIGSTPPVTYALRNLSPGGALAINAPISGDTKISARISAPAVPEPSSVVMCGIGFVGLIGLGLRRRMQITQGIA